MQDVYEKYGKKIVDGPSDAELKELANMPIILGVLDSLNNAKDNPAQVLDKLFQLFHALGEKGLADVNAEELTQILNNTPAEHKDMLYFIADKLSREVKGIEDESLKEKINNLIGLCEDLSARDADSKQSMFNKDSEVAYKLASATAAFVGKLKNENKRVESFIKWIENYQKKNPGHDPFGLSRKDPGKIKIVKEAQRQIKDLSTADIADMIIAKPELADIFFKKRHNPFGRNFREEFAKHPDQIEKIIEHGGKEACLAMIGQKLFSSSHFDKQKAKELESKALNVQRQPATKAISEQNAKPVPPSSVPPLPQRPSAPQVPPRPANSLKEMKDYSKEIKQQNTDNLANRQACRKIIKEKIANKEFADILIKELDAKAERFTYPPSDAVENFVKKN